MVKDTFIETNSQKIDSFRLGSLIKGEGLMANVNGEEIDRFASGNKFNFDPIPVEPYNESGDYPLFVPVIVHIYRGTMYEAWTISGEQITPSNVSEGVWVYGLWYYEDWDLDEFTDASGRPVAIEATRKEWNNWKVQVNYL